MGAFIRLATDQQSAPMSIDDARAGAKIAYGKAREAQRRLVGDLGLIELLYRPGNVSRARLRGELREAQRQAERAQAVVSHLAHALEVIETTAATTTDPRPTARETNPEPEEGEHV